MRGGILFRAAALVAALITIVLPGVAEARTGSLDGAPLDVFVDGQGGLQVRFDSARTGEFCCGSNQGDAGLTLREGSALSDISDPGREITAGPDLDWDFQQTQSLTTTYEVPLPTRLSVKERISYTNGTREVHARYEITNIGDEAVDFSAGELADLYSGGSDVGGGVFNGDAPRFVGGTSRFGGATGLEEVDGSKWTSYEEGYYGDVFRHFTAGGLANQIVRDDEDNGAGAEWDVTGLEPNATKTIDVVWRFDARVVVTTAEDHEDGECDSDCTLREAIAQAPDGAGIEVPYGTYTLDPALGPLSAEGKKTLSLYGAGARGEAGSTIDAGHQVRALNVGGGTSLTLSGFHIENGSGGDGDGGAVAVQPGGALKLVDSQIEHSTAANGAGIASAGDLTVLRSTIAGNVAGDEGHAGHGGGLYLSGGSAEVLDSTIGDNVVYGSGGGIASSAPLTLLNTTIARNRAQAADGVAGTGGGVARLDSAVTATNTLLAANTPAACAAGFGAATASHDFVDDQSCKLGAGNFEGGEALLASLDDNGGDTDTYLPGPRSPAIDAGDGEACGDPRLEGIDQRGEERVLGFACDIGAVEQVSEIHDVAPPAILSPRDGAVVDSREITFRGTAAPDDVVDVHALAADAAAQTTTNADGTWSVTLSVPDDGKYRFAAAASEGYSISDDSDAVAVTVDTKAPAAPQIDAAAAAGGSTVVLSGTAERGAHVAILDGAEQVAGTSAADGTWTVTLEDVSLGHHTYKAVATDAAGHDSPPSEGRDVLVRPASPRIVAPREGSLFNTGTIAFRGTAKPGVTVQVVELETKASAETKALDDGTWSATMTLPEGTYRFAASVTVDGTPSDQTDPVTVTIDTSAPAAPQITGGGAGGSTVTLSGTADPGSAIAILDGGTRVATTSAPNGTWSVTLNNVPPGPHHYTAVATDPAGNPSSASATRDVVVPATVVAAATPTPTPTQTTSNSAPQQLPPPVVGKQVNAETKSGKVLIRLPGSNKFVELGPEAQIPTGTIVDATKGRITLTTAVGGGTQHADFYQGIFKVTQSTGAHPLTTLTLAGPKPTCSTAHTASASAKKKVKTRKLWGSGSGAFRTSGQFSSATVRGTTWLTQDSCAGTLTKVTGGVVSVRDFARRKNVLVRKGHSYLARARRR